MTVIVGIDPGMTGAVARFVGASLTRIDDLPTFGGRIDGSELAGLLQGIDMVYMENTHPMPRNGSIASFKLGLNSGVIIGVTQALAIPLSRISVATWRRWAGLGKASKDASLGLARELYPHLRHELRLAKHHNRAEAVLIGRYGIYHQLHERNADVQGDDDAGSAGDRDVRGDDGRDRHPADQPSRHQRAVEGPGRRGEGAAQVRPLVRPGPTST